MRKKITSQELKRSARRPWKRCGKGISFPSTGASAPLGNSSAATPAANSTHSSNVLGAANSSTAVPQVQSSGVSASTAAALAGLTSNPQAMAAMLAQHPMLAQSLPLLNNHFGGNNFLGMPSSTNSGNNSTSKLSR